MYTLLLFEYKIKESIDKILVNFVCLDIIDTYGTGGKLGHPVDGSVKVGVWVTTLADDNSTGLFFRDRKEVSW